MNITLYDASLTQELLTYLHTGSFFNGKLMTGLVSNFFPRPYEREDRRIMTKVLFPGASLLKISSWAYFRKNFSVCNLKGYGGGGGLIS